ncbi:DUF2254 domain-containing protein [Piscinibacter sakaiensis]|uniref:DUF2254 domain-containing protein n=1 Tax=Piscinibacter sakaiensis TaxID=1547922 RepID=UPI003AAB44AB
MYRFFLWVKDNENQLWVKPAIGSLFAIGFALFAAAGNQLDLPKNFPEIERDTLDGLLTVIASSMLAVTTFSLSIMVSAFASASAAATPRATALVIGDEHAHNAIASFISAFIYSIIAKSALGVSYYGPTGRFILFISTLAVLIYLIYTLIRWVRTMSSLGRMGNTIDKIEVATTNAMQNYRDRPTMGALLSAPTEPVGVPVRCEEVAYVRHINIEGLQAMAVEIDGRIHIMARPGTLVDPGTVLLYIESSHEDIDLERARNAVLLGKMRSFDQDPRFGMIVLSEVAQRALSPAVNDPGTAISVMNAMARILISTRPNPNSTDSGEFDRLSLVEIDETDLVRQGFDPISRDGAAIFEVIIRMQKLLASIAEQAVLSLKMPAHQQAADALRRACQSLALESEKQAITDVFGQLHGHAVKLDADDADAGAARATAPPPRTTAGEPA